MPLQTLQVQTDRRLQMVDITRHVAGAVRASSIADGTVLLYVPHTTCGVTIQENADPGVQQDMLLVLDEVAPRQDQRYRHIEDNSASHVQASMMGFSAFVFVQQGSLVLGRWQAIYLAEFDGPRQRLVHLKVLDDRLGAG